jgi:hypothetical protein
MSPVLVLWVGALVIYFIGSQKMGAVLKVFLDKIKGSTTPTPAPSTPRDTPSGQA